jgi:hypothetical protein
LGGGGSEETKKDLSSRSGVGFKRERFEGEEDGVWEQEHRRMIETKDREKRRKRNISCLLYLTFGNPASSLKAELGKEFYLIIFCQVRI